MIMPKKGFTFVELLVAILIFCIILGSLYSAFRVGLAAYRKGEQFAHFYQRLRLSLDAMALDLRNCYAFSPDDAKFIFENQKLSFYTRKRFFTSGSGSYFQICRVEYWLDKDSLSRRVFAGSLALAEDSQLKVQSLLDNVAQLKVEFPFRVKAEEAIAWREEWPQKEKIPLALRLSLGIRENEKSEKTINLTKLIFIPCGQLGEEENK
jgi:type II secretion system protein J